MAVPKKQAWGAYGPVYATPRAGQSLYGYANQYTPTATPKRVPARAPGVSVLPGMEDFETPGYTPDYASLISGDYEYQAALGAYGAQDIADEAQLNEYIGGLGQAYNAQKTDLDRQLARGGAQGDVDLASRGTLQSGALAVLRGALNEGYTKSLNQAGSQRAEGERAARGSYAKNVADRAAQLSMLRAQVAMRLQQDPRYQPQAGLQAKWNPYVQAYVDESGGMYGANRQQIPNSTYGGGTPGPVRVDAKGNVWSGGQIVYNIGVPGKKRR